MESTSIKRDIDGPFEKEFYLSRMDIGSLMSMEPPKRSSRASTVGREVAASFVRADISPDPLIGRFTLRG